MDRISLRAAWRCLVMTAATLAVAGLAACGGGGGSGTSGGAGSLGLAGNGSLRLAMTDAPSCGFDHVFVTVDRIRVNQNSSAGDNDAGWSEIALAAPTRIDLLALTNGVLQELGQTSLPSGRYTQVRLVLAPNTGANPLANAVQPSGSAAVALNTPSGQQSGLKLQAQFDVQAGQTSDLVLDFDACRSVVPAGNSGNFNLKPLVRVLQRNDAGIRGFVSTTLLGTTATATVSAQQSGTVIRSTVPDSGGKFELPFLPPGSYDLVVAADGRSTAVVTAVPVTASTTVVNGTATAILPPLSNMAPVSGTTTASGTATPVTDADVRATQTLSAAGPTVEVAHQAVNAVTAAYALRLPVAGPVKAPFAAGGTLSFGVPDPGVAGQYRIEASAPGRTTAAQATSVAGSANQTVNLTFAP